MIFLDANVILRALTISDDPQVRRASHAASDLFRLVRLGEAEVTTSDAILAEAAFILTAKSHYHVPAAEAAAKLAGLISLRGFRLPGKGAMLRALELWASAPQLGFVDALTATYARAPGMQLASFDADFDGIPGITRWNPSGAS